MDIETIRAHVASAVEVLFAEAVENDWPLTVFNLAGRREFHKFSQDNDLTQAGQDAWLDEWNKEVTEYPLSELRS